METITMNHGAGGRVMHQFVSETVAAHLGNEYLLKMDDAAVLPVPAGKRLALTTDSYVVTPRFFPGGDVGKLAICGTVNDLATSGATPAYITLAFILEEGFPLSELDRIVASIGETAREAGVQIVTGDTKVVEKGKGDGIFINTAGVGFVDEDLSISTHSAKPGDVVLINGPMGNHEVALFTVREELPFDVTVLSDAAPLNHMVATVLEHSRNIRTIKDPTRGGVASALFEICDHSHVSIRLFEEKLPVDREVHGVCELVGFDPLYLANEGKFIVVCPPEDEAQVLEAMGPEAVTIGLVWEHGEGLVVETLAGGLRGVCPAGERRRPRKQGGAKAPAGTPDRAGSPFCLHGAAPSAGSSGAVSFS